MNINKYVKSIKYVKIFYNLTFLHRMQLERSFAEILYFFEFLHVYIKMEIIKQELLMINLGGHGQEVCFIFTSQKFVLKIQSLAQY